MPLFRNIRMNSLNSNPSTPASGFVEFFFRDKKPYYTDDTGLVYSIMQPLDSVLSQGNDGGSHNMILGGTLTVNNEITCNNVIIQ